MEIASDLTELMLSIESAKCKLTSRGEQISFLHEAILAVLNILDLKSDLCNLRSCGLNENTWPSSVVQLHKLRQTFHKNVAEIKPASLHLPSTSIQPHVETCSNPGSPRVSAILHRVLSSLQDLCGDEWKHLFQISQPSIEGQSLDPLSRVRFIDEQSSALILQQLEAIQDQCKELEEQENRFAAKGQSASGQMMATCIGEAHGNRMSSELINDCNINDCIWKIEERLSGYEEGINRLLGDLMDWKKEQWITALEENHQLLAEPRLVKRLFASGLRFMSRSGESVTEVEADNHKRLLKLSSQSFAALPLPLQCTVFQWLWDQPQGPDLFRSKEVMNVQQELTRVFNRLVTGLPDSQIIEIAREVCCVALHSPSSTLEKAIREAVRNTDTGNLVCKVLQCMPFLVKLEVDGISCFLNELNKFVRRLDERELSSTEELSLFKFFHGLIKPYHSPRHSGLPAMFPPLTPSNQLAECLVWPFLTMSSHRHGDQSQPLEITESSIATGSNGVPIDIALKLLDLIFDTSMTPHPSNEPQLFDASASLSTVLCLCQLLDNCDGLLNGGEEKVSWFTIRELSTGLLQKFGKHIEGFQKDVLLHGAEWLLHATADMEWTTELSVNALFSDVIPVCKKNIEMIAKEITGSLSESCNKESQEKQDHGPAYLTWSGTMKVFFQGCRISSPVTDLFIKHLPSDLLKGSRQDFYKAVCVALCQVLPHSTMTEWRAIMRSLDQLIADDALRVSYATQYVTSLPMFDFTMYRRPLQLSQVLTATMQLLATNGCVSDQMTLQAWQHITRSYAHTMKDLLNMATTIHTANSSDSAHCVPAALLFVIGQLFCHSCEVTRCVPAACSEQLFVWCLELLMRVEEMVTNHAEDVVVRDWAHRESKMLSRMVESMPGVEHRSTLQHKLSAFSPTG